MADLLSSMKKNGVILYGAGRIGKDILKRLERKNIPILCIWDNNASNIGGTSDKIRVPDYDYENKAVYIILCVYSETLSQGISKTLRERGFYNIYRYDEMELLTAYCDGMNMNSVECNRCLLSQGGCEKYIQKIKKDKISCLNIKRLSLSAIVRCTLNCKNCIQCMTQYKKTNLDCQYNFEDFSSVWEKIEKVFGWLNVVQLAGGELFLYKNWKQILDICVQSEYVGLVNVLTNGIHRLKKDDIQVLANPKIVVLVDDYTTKLNERQKEIFEHTVDDFKRYGVNYLILDNTNGTWFDYGSFEENEFEEAELIQLYNNCMSNECYCVTWDYSFTICGRSRIACDLGYVDTTKDDCVDLLNNNDIDDIRERIRRLCEKEYLEICKYCNGNKYVVPAGEQTKS